MLPSISPGLLVLAVLGPQDHHGEQGDADPYRRHGDAVAVGAQGAGEDEDHE